MINLVVLTAVMSAPNSILYSTGCHLYQIAQDLLNRFLEAIKASARLLSETGLEGSLCFERLSLHRNRHY